ncbi:unnamed protein product [Rotaria socialis]|uniref:Uncharacterized protein n=1 Tax=Rotaria socialis TaxID=392032 RepID=A0A818EGF1_9BILA|nr:unnamed protein product [Rotaria socialis]CAF4893480.1 unnamed protein product [Rotaria socialis]
MPLWTYMTISTLSAIFIISVFQCSWSKASDISERCASMNSTTNFRVNFLVNSKKGNKKCRWYFLKYKQSEWENYWFSNIEQFQNNVCELLGNAYHGKKAILTLERLKELQTFGRNRTRSNKREADKLLSRMFYRMECINPHTKVLVQVAEVSQVIEPLVGLLRDPFTICRRNNSLSAFIYEGAELQPKRFLLLSIAAPFYIHWLLQNEENTVKNSIQSSRLYKNLLPWMYQRDKISFSDAKSQLDTPNELNILIDLGSSYFQHWDADNNSAAGLWSYEQYKRFGIQFDRIIAFEKVPLDPRTAWDQLPEDVFPYYTLINVGCEATGKFSPWVILKRIAKLHDHVVVKLDIDVPSIEGPLIDQLLNDSSINSLIDEAFFEHHISVREMQAYWGNPPEKLKDSFVLFTKLRQLGIRMHSWP